MQRHHEMDIMLTSEIKDNIRIFKFMSYTQEKYIKIIYNEKY